MAAALTPSYVSQSQPCPSHPTAGKRQPAASGPGGSAGRGCGEASEAELSLPSPISVWGFGVLGESPGPVGLVAGLTTCPSPPPEGIWAGCVSVRRSSPARGHQLAQPGSASQSGGSGGSLSAPRPPPRGQGDQAPRGGGRRERRRFGFSRRTCSHPRPDQGFLEGKGTSQSPQHRP